jgi:hypothetical protein
MLSTEAQWAVVTFEDVVLYNGSLGLPVLRLTWLFLNGVEIRLWMLLALSIPLCLSTQWMLSDSSVASQTEALPPGSPYVSIGSSYAAGFDIQPQELGAGACGRSLLDYPHPPTARPPGSALP